MSIYNNFYRLREHKKYRNTLCSLQCWGLLGAKCSVASIFTFAAASSALNIATSTTSPQLMRVSLITIRFYFLTFQLKSKNYHRNIRIST